MVGCVEAERETSWEMAFGSACNRGPEDFPSRLAAGNTFFSALSCGKAKPLAVQYPVQVCVNTAVLRFLK